ncbi:heavy metal-responsive transcriptional regulator [Nodosilinea sp. LEGE 07298]|uniref:heavy metal-responsive transcriptional regulator n=1 Tax=Nodosilinea sp. LEGE 07298 TaxID=2777970 RepID=UPI001882B20D|nr:heavy metal-responsive transcriptional regulator [Nodosilinea sp. LEGE 07298]MBE9108193.1 heavy metal-responsive transcriptional regulator [Nodosilinea sp. LEGE 07298]
MLTEAPPKLIGAVAKKSGLPVKTIRYYDEIGLLKTAGRTEGGYRVFAEDVFTRLGFIRRAQSLGLTLTEVKEFLEVHDQGDLPCSHIQVKLEDKLTEIEEKIQQLQLLKHELSGLLSGWQSIATKTDEAICPIIEN